MRTSPPFTIKVAQLPGGNEPTEDRVFIAPNAVIVLDGATQLRKLERDGGWIAHELGQRLIDGLVRSPEVALDDLLEAALYELVEVHQLQPATSPSTTVNIVRLTATTVDVLVLCDSPVAIRHMDGKVHAIRDDRIGHVLSAIGRPVGRHRLGDSKWDDALSEFESLRNTSDGFWVASANPRAAREAITQSIPREDVVAILSMTDGVSVGVDRYGSPASWLEAFSLAEDLGPHAVLELVQTAENQDLDCVRWPRTKPHDDKILAIVRLK